MSLFSHPPTEALLAHAKGDRDQARADLEAYIRKQFEGHLPLFGLSMRCEALLKHRVDLDKHDCGNDGSGCLCKCHDATWDPSVIIATNV